MAQEFPQLDFQGSLGKQGEHWNEAFSAGNQSHSFGLVLTIPLFSAGSTLTTYYEKKNAQESVEVKSEQELLHLRNEVHQEAVQIQALRKSLESVTQSWKANEEIVKLSFKSYQLGKLTITELLASQNDLLDAKAGYAKAKLDLAALVSKFSADLGLPNAANVAIVEGNP
jgi:outer membrane protein